MPDPGSAYHELGHVLALIHYRRPWQWVALDAVPGYGGWTCFEPDRIPPFERSVIALAGSIAQARYLRREIAVAPADRRIAMDALASLDDNQPDGTEVVRQATAIINANWPLIERGAQALLNAPAGRLTCDEVAKLLAAPTEREWRSLPQPAVSSTA
jgi:hypothetical protein